jgi:hypothetical protein
MQTPVEIEYQGMEARPHIQAAVCTEYLIQHGRGEQTG